MGTRIYRSSLVPSHTHLGLCTRSRHLGAIGASLYGENTVEPHAWLGGHLHQLKHTGPDEILAEMRVLQKKFPEKQEITRHLAYLEKRKQHVLYPMIQAQASQSGAALWRVATSQIAIIDSLNMDITFACQSINLLNLLAMRSFPAFRKSSCKFYIWWKSAQRQLDSLFGGHRPTF